MPRLATTIALFACLLCANLHAQTAQDQFSIAAGFYSRGQWQDAVDTFEELIRTHPESDAGKEAFFFLGESQFQLENWVHARIAYQKFLVLMPGSEFAVRASFRLAEVSYRSGDLQAATMLEGFIRDHQQSEYVQFAAAYLGEIRLKRDEALLARHVFEKALEQFPSSAMREDYLLGLGKSFQRLGQSDEARATWQALASANDLNVLKEANLRLGQLAFAEGDWNAAHERFNYLRRAAGDDDATKYKALYWLARCELQQGNAIAAIDFFEQLDPDQVSNELGPAVYHDGAVAKIQAGQTEDALKWLQRIRSKWPQSNWSDDALQMEIEIHQRSGARDEALALIDVFNRRFPHSLISWKVAQAEGRLKYELPDYGATVRIFSRLLENAPDDATERATWNYFVGLGNIGLEKYNEAIAALEQIELTDEKDFNAAVAIARGTALSASGRFRDARQEYQNYLDLMPGGVDVPRCLSELAICDAELLEWAAADKWLSRLHSDFPQSEYLVPAASNIASTALREDQLSVAAKWFELLIEPTREKKQIATGLTGLAWVYHKGGESERALEHFERILTEFPDSDFATDAAMARAKQLDDANSWAEAAETYELVVDRTRRNRLANIARLRIAHCRQKLGGAENLKAAMKAATEYLQSPSDKDHPDEAIYQLAWIYNDLGLKTRSMARFEELTTNYVDSKYWADAAYRVAEKAFAAKDFEQAESLATRLLHQTDQTEILSRSVYMKGQMAANNNDWDSVISSMRAVTKRCDDKVIYAKANYWLAEALYQTGDWVAAGDIFQQLINRNNLLDEATWPWVALRTSQCHAQIENWGMVKENSTAAKTRYPAFRKNYEHDYLLGRSAEQLGRLTESREFFNAVVTSPTGGKTETAAKAQWRIGETYFHQERYEDAIRAFYKVDSLFTYNKWRAAALYEAGKCQEHLGNWTKAVILYQQLIDDIPENELVDEAQKRLDFANRQAGAGLETEQNQDRQALR